MQALAIRWPPEANAHRLFPGNGKSSAVSRQRISSTSACNESASVLSDPRTSAHCPENPGHCGRIQAFVVRISIVGQSKSGAAIWSNRISVRTETSRESNSQKKSKSGGG
ncbi:hypothetical protein B7R78_0015890 [Ralstonia solanacearum]|uniref:hypothetical protein n=1 Tax=Ralstonia solanacearum species complex TaxID=3116862 RepID=UPI0011404E6D|nr:hypothetical protein [Ralstonia solanacearum]MBT1538534.1 hypothetical protein [Ralstonia solanacearum]QOK81949.1 hypothetical protein HF906_07115 [Ralstonia solanacearum]